MCILLLFKKKNFGGVGMAPLCPLLVPSLNMRTRRTQAPKEILNKDTSKEDWRFEKLGWNNSRDSY